MHCSVLILSILFITPLSSNQENDHQRKGLSLEDKISFCDKKLAEQRKSYDRQVKQALKIFDKSPANSPLSHKYQDILLDLGPSIAEFLLPKIELKGGQKKIGENCTAVIAKIVKKYQNRSLLPRLLQLLKSSNAGTRRRVTSILKEYTGNSISADPLLEAYQSEQNPTSKGDLLLLIIRSGSDKVNPLILEALKSKSPVLKIAASQSAAKLGIEEAILILSGLLVDNEPSIRDAAFQALKTFEGPALLTVLHQWFEGEENDPPVEAIILLGEKGDRASLQILRKFVRRLLKTKSAKKSALLEEAIFACNLHGDESFNDEILSYPKREMQKNPKNYRNIYYLGRLYYRLRKFKTALTVFNKILTLENVSLPNFYYGLICTDMARCHSLSGDVRKALDYLEKARLDDYSMILTDPDFENVKQDGRYRKRGLLIFKPKKKQK